VYQNLPGYKLIAPAKPVAAGGSGAFKKSKFPGATLNFSLTIADTGHTHTKAGRFLSG
jgi:hypothetical protein